MNLCYFRIVPVEGTESEVSLAPDEMRQIFEVVAKLQSPMVDVLRDDEYAYSFCRLGGEDGFWAIFEREEPVTTYR